MRRIIPLLILTAALLPAAESILVHGHRGARASRPENTIPAFEFAIQAGADVLELDVAVTKDNVLVVSHDPTMNLSICQGPPGPVVIREMTLEELRRWDCGTKKNKLFPDQVPVPGARVPTLDEVLSLAVRGKFEFNIETKSFPKSPQYTPPPEDFARLMAEVIRRHKLESRCIVQSFDYRTLHAMRKIAPAIRLSALEGSRPISFVEIAKEAGAAIVSPHFKLVTAEKVAEAHRAGLQVIPWTANTVEEWDRLIEAQVDAIITDDPAGLIAHLNRRGLR